MVSEDGEVWAETWMMCWHESWIDQWYWHPSQSAEIQSDIGLGVSEKKHQGQHCWHEVNAVMWGHWGRDRFCMAWEDFVKTLTFVLSGWKTPAFIKELHLSWWRLKYIVHKALFISYETVISYIFLLWFWWCCLFACLFVLGKRVNLNLLFPIGWKQMFAIMVLPFLTFHVNEIIYYVVFWVVFLSFSIMLLRFIHVLCMSVVFSLLLLSRISLYGCTTVFKLFFSDQYFNSFTVV